MSAITLGSNTPEKNSASGDAPANPLVVSATVDGTGAIIVLSSGGSDAVAQWLNQPGPDTTTPVPGSVTIRLSDCNGNDLVIQPIKLCLNGVSGTMYFLCSNFVPD
jgi:hypothetical protein